MFDDAPKEEEEVFKVLTRFRTINDPVVVEQLAVSDGQDGVSDFKRTFRQWANEEGRGYSLLASAYLGVGLTFYTVGITMNNPPLAITGVGFIGAGAAIFTKDYNSWLRLQLIKNVCDTIDENANPLRTGRPLHYFMDAGKESLKLCKYMLSKKR